jgi:hypothetical protein
LPRPNWSQPITEAPQNPSVTTLKTLADVRTLMQHLPDGHRRRSTWRHVAQQLAAAADGGGDINDAVDLVAPGAAARERAVPAAVKREAEEDWGR